MLIFRPPYPFFYFFIHFIFFPVLLTRLSFAKWYISPSYNSSPPHQVARTITNMQQQIQQHQRQLYQALLMKQQLPSHSSSSSSSAGLHPPGGPVSSKSILDPFTGPHQASGLADSLHTKEPPSSPNAYNTYPLSKAGQYQCCALTVHLKAITKRHYRGVRKCSAPVNTLSVKQLDWIQTWM